MRSDLRLLFVLAPAVIFLDQISKVLIRHYLYPGESVSVVGDFVRFTLIFNEGAAFGISLGHYPAYSILAALSSALLIYYVVRSGGKSVWPRYFLALIIGGALGNLLDRLLYGRVVDFIDVDIPDISLPSFYVAFLRFPGYHLTRWFTFNLADSAITIGLIGFIFSLGSSGKVTTSGESDATSSPGTTDSDVFSGPAPR